VVGLVWSKMVLTLRQDGAVARKSKDSSDILSLPSPEEHLSLVY
jgi:hypothetical protein